MRRQLMLLCSLVVAFVSLGMLIRPGWAISTALAASATPFPKVVQAVTIAVGADVRDFRLDARAHRLYVTDTADTLTILDSDDYSVMSKLPIGGDLLLDERHGRLFVFPGSYPLGEATKSVTVIATDSMTVLGVLPDATHVSIDPVNDRLFTGVRYSSYSPDNTSPIRVYDGATLAQTGVISVTGIPVYNPMRRELVVLAYRAISVDIDSGQELADLLPEQTSHPFEFCNGCDYPIAAHVFPERNLLVVPMQRMSTGGGGGIPPEPRYFNATTLMPLEATDLDLMYQPTCGSRPVLTPAIDGRLFENRHFSRYIFVQNWVVDDTAGNRLALREGVYADFVNPATRQAVVDQGYVVELDTLLPIGRFPSFCWFDYDAVTGRFYGGAEGDLLVMSEVGGAPQPFAPSEASALPQSAIAQILPSPNLAEDATVFLATSHGTVLRSVDAGETWVHLRGGLPETDDLQIMLAISPDFAHDRTLFAGGHVGTFRGEGVLKSTDGGETWTPLWQGMEYLRVNQLAISPHYADDGQVFARSEFYEIQPWQNGRAIYASDTGGLSWRIAYSTTGTVASEAYTAKWAELTNGPVLPVRLEPYAERLEVLHESAWQRADLGLDSGDYLLDAVAAPGYPSDPAIYVRSRLALFRSDDHGQTWSKWNDGRLAGRDYSNNMTAMAVGQTQDDHVIYVGTANGELWRIPGQSFVTEDIAVVFETQPEPTQDTHAPAPTPEPPAQPAGDAAPPAGLFRPEGPLAAGWEADPELRAGLGWALAPGAQQTDMAQQAFAGGAMLWRRDTQTIYVLADDGHWTAYVDTFTEGEPEEDPSLKAPAGYLQPIRGFGVVWREHPDVQENLGWALTPESAVTGAIHRFERGFIIGTGVRMFALIAETPNSGVWR